MNAWARREFTVLGFDVRDGVGLVTRLHELALADNNRQIREMLSAAGLRREDLTSALTNEKLKERKQTASQDPETMARYERFVDRQIEDLRTGQVPSAQLGFAYKAVIFSTRAYQDGLARVLRVALGEANVPRTRMVRELKLGRPIGTLLDERLPGYRPWFGRWKALRDQVKYGADASIQGGSDTGIGIRLKGFRDSTQPDGPDLTIYLRHIDETLSHSSAVAELATEQLTLRTDSS